MKRNVSLVVLACEIGMIILLHAAKMNQAGQKGAELGGSVTKVTTITPVGKHRDLLSLK